MYKTVRWHRQQHDDREGEYEFYSWRRECITLLCLPKPLPKSRMTHCFFVSFYSWPVSSIIFFFLVFNVGINQNKTLITCVECPVSLTIIVWFPQHNLMYHFIFFDDKTGDDSFYCVLLNSKSCRITKGCVYSVLILLLASMVGCFLMFHSTPQW